MPLLPNTDSSEVEIVMVQDGESQDCYEVRRFVSMAQLQRAKLLKMQVSAGALRATQILQDAKDTGVFSVDDVSAAQVMVENANAEYYAIWIAKWSHDVPLTTENIKRLKGEHQKRISEAIDHHMELLNGGVSSDQKKPSTDTSAKP